MKAKSIIQKRVVELSGSLPTLTTAQVKWAFTHTHELYGYRTKQGTTCMVCGHQWTQRGEGKCRCPHCGQTIEIKDTKKRVLKQKSFFNVITTKEEFQVVRMFQLMSECRKGYPAKYAHIAIGEYWIAPNGKTTVMGLCRSMNSWYYDSFNLCSPFEIRHDNECFQRIAGEWVYPRVKATDTIKRNGFKGCCHNIHPVELFKQLLTNPKAETLMKAGEIELLRHLCYHPNEVSKYWDTIKIAMRHGYKVSDSQMYMDYISMLDRMGKDLHNPALIAPRDLQAAHDDYVAKVERQRIKEQREADRERAMADETEFEQLKGRYTGLVMTDGEITIHTLNSVAEYYDEGSRQHICVGSSRYYLKPESLVLTAKIGNKTIATIEVSLQDCTILQCRAFANGVSEYQERIASLIAANTHLIAERKIA